MCLTISLRSPASQVAVQLVLEHVTHLIPPVFLLHYHQSRVFRQRFRHQRRPLNVAANDLVSPPLVRHFMGCHVENVVDVLFIICPEHETRSL